MRWNKKYNYPSSSRSTEDGIRRYILGETKLPSVTSILDATKSEEDKAALACLLYTSDAADDLLCVDLGGRRIIKKK